MRGRLARARPGVVRFATLARTLAGAEFKLRYLDSPLSYLWLIARPLLLFAVLYFVFTHVARFQRGVDHYALYLLTAIVLWTYFAESTGTAVSALVRRSDVLRKVPMPRSAIPISVALTSFIDLGMNLLAVLVFFLIGGVTPRVSWLELPLLLALLSLLVAGIALLLSALYVRYRDLDQVWVVIRQALFYGTPILYVAASLPDDVERIYVTANPLAVIFTEARHALIDPSAPSAAQAVGGAGWLLIPLTFVLAVFCLGLWVFRRDSPYLAENL